MTTITKVLQLSSIQRAQPVLCLTLLASLGGCGKPTAQDDFPARSRADAGAIDVDTETSETAIDENPDPTMTSSVTESVVAPQVSVPVLPLPTATAETPASGSGGTGIGGAGIGGTDTGSAGVSATSGSNAGGSAGLNAEGTAGLGGGNSAGSGALGNEAGAAGAGGSTFVPLPISPEIGPCPPPCGVTLQPDDMYVGGAAGATVFIDFETGTSSLRNDPDSASANEEVIISFTFEDNQYGFGAWVQSPYWFIWSDNFVYDADGYSLQQDTVMSAQITDSDTGRTAIVRFAFTDGAVMVFDAYVPACDAAGTGACQSDSDCPLVEEGLARAAAEQCAAGCSDTACTTSCSAEATGLSSACSSCYTELLECVATCEGICPGQGGNVCLNCEVEAECHTRYMQCSGLDYMPPGTLTLPL